MLFCLIPFFFFLVKKKKNFLRNVSQYKRFIVIGLQFIGRCVHAITPAIAQYVRYRTSPQYSPMGISYPGKC